MTTKKNDGNGVLGAHASPARRLKPRPSRRPPAFEAEIGKKMRAMYEDLMEQPLPDRFLELLNKIDQAQVDPAQENKSR